jgi:hypothetical protein
MCMSSKPTKQPVIQLSITLKPRYKMCMSWIFAFAFALVSSVPTRGLIRILIKLNLQVNLVNT